MAVKGLLLTLDQNDSLADSALSALRAHAGIELGELRERWIPVVVDATDEAESRETMQWIEALEGVYFTDTVFASVEAPHAAEFENEPQYAGEH